MAAGACVIAKEARIVVFSGRVQGVGFRYTAVQFARQLPLAGSVRNLEDGRVELAVEGPARAIDELLRRLHEHFGAFIRSMNQTPAAVQNLPPGFRILH